MDKNKNIKTTFSLIFFFHLNYMIDPSSQIFKHTNL